MLEIFRINSRAGNWFIAVSGVLYAVAAVPLLAYHAATTWGAESLIDRALQLALLFTIAAGVAFAAIARANLRRLGANDGRAETATERRSALSTQSA